MLICRVRDCGPADAVASAGLYLLSNPRRYAKIYLVAVNKKPEVDRSVQDYFSD